MVILIWNCARIVNEYLPGATPVAERVLARDELPMADQ
jgi:hypothetical protein